MKEYILLADLIERTIIISRECIKFIDEGLYDQLFDRIERREKLISIIQTIHERMHLAQISQESLTSEQEEANNQLNQLIARMQEMDDYILLKLAEEKNNTQNEIAKLFKNKENFKGYNLNSVK